VWHARPNFVRGDAEAADLANAGNVGVAARLVIGDAALMLAAGALPSPYQHRYDLGSAWKDWTGLPFVFAVWVANRAASTSEALAVHASLIESRNWGLAHLDILATEAAAKTGVSQAECSTYLQGLDYGLSYPHLGGLTEFYRRLTVAGHVAPGRLSFLPAA
jgi:chorismate dehydratase